MSKVIRLDQQPTLENSLINSDVENVVIFPIYSDINGIAKIFCCSPSTVRRLLDRAVNEGYGDIRIRVSQTKVLVKISEFEKFLREIDSKYL
ncbi:hypothetical protein ETI10_06285 [Macrococcoides goetzii]|nr:hypothetical protein [Macrococcus goetzii]TDM40250.1 hypothetical protein ETI10_06285 [Macrococcus goetzii]